MTSTNILIFTSDKQALGAIESLTIKEFVQENEPASVNAKLEITRMRLSRERLNETFKDGKFHVDSQIYPVHIIIVEDKVETIRATNVWFSGISVSYMTDEWVISEGVEAECESVTGTKTYKSSAD
jgi:hypothetical protein